MKTKKKTKRKSQIAATMIAAAGATGNRIETIRAARNAGCEAFRANGNVHIPTLLKFLANHPEIKRATKHLPDLPTERALKMRAERKQAELELDHQRKSLVKFDLVKGFIGGLAAITRSRLRQLPDRLCQKYEVIIKGVGARLGIPADELPDLLAIKEDLTKEVDDCLRSFKEMNAEEIFKEIPKS